MIHRMRSFALILFFAASVPPARAAEVVFEKDVLPILQKRCFHCHGAETNKSDLDVRTLAGVLHGGKSGPAVSPGSPERSLLWIKVAGDKMPAEGDKLPEAEKAVVRSWIESGAKGSATVTTKPDERGVTDADRQFWSFKRPVRSAVPVVKQTEKVRNPIDAYLLAALEKKGLTLSEEADRQKLLRRLYFDLTGLPPTPAEVQSFLTDEGPDAYERVVDRLLASPRYGERWGRHWLDLARYADSEGFKSDETRPNIWRYRDYVIDAFNQDKPYDRFIKEQIAGDELCPSDPVALVATGFNRHFPDESNARNLMQRRQ